MNESKPFVDAIEAEPFDAGTRLVYADWLDDHGQHIDAAVQRVLAHPADDQLRLTFANVCEAEAGRCCAGKFLVLPETKLGQWVEFLKNLAKFVRVQIKITNWTVEPLDRGNRLVDCRTSRSMPGTTYVCRATPYRINRRCEFHKLMNEEVGLVLPDCKIWFNLPPGWNTKFHRDISIADRPTAYVDRGFVHRVACGGLHWVEKAAWLLRYHPIRHVRLQDEPLIAWVDIGKRKLCDGRKVLDVGSEEKASNGNLMLPLLLKNEWPEIEFDLSAIPIRTPSQPV